MVSNRTLVALKPDPPLAMQHLLWDTTALRVPVVTVVANSLPKPSGSNLPPVNRTLTTDLAAINHRR